MGQGLLKTNKEQKAAAEEDTATRLRESEGDVCIVCDTSDWGHGAQPGEPVAGAFSLSPPLEVHKFCVGGEKEDLIVFKLSYSGILGAVGSLLIVCPYLE